MNGPRHDVAAEQIVLGAALLDHRIIDDLTIQAEDFYRPIHEQLWRLITTEHRAGNPTDIVAIGQRITTTPIRGMEPGYLVDLMQTVPTIQNGPYYSRLVSALAQLRRLEETGIRITQIAAEAPWDKAADALEEARAEVDRSAKVTSADSTIRTYGEALADAMEKWETPDRDVWATGWTDLDRILNGGWRPGHLTIMGARPAVGKSLVAACASKQAAERGVGVMFFALEMSEDEVVARIAANSAGVDLSRIETRSMTDIDWQRVARHAGAAYDWPLVVDDRARLSVAQIRAKVRTVQRRFATPLVVVDYLQLARPADARENRERQVSRIAEECKLLAKEFGVHVLALAQVNRGPEHRQEKRPTMSDLRESGGLEAHADEVIMLHRDDEESPGEIELHVEKNRHGRTGKVALAWAPHMSAARDMYRGGAA